MAAGLNIPDQSQSPQWDKFLFDKEEEETSIDIMRYVSVVLRRWQVVAAIMLVMFLAGIVKNVKSPRLYTSATTLMIKSRPVVDVMGFQYYRSFVEERNKWNTYKKVLRSDPLLKRVQRSLELPFSVETYYLVVKWVKGRGRFALTVVAP